MRINNVINNPGNSFATAESFKKSVIHNRFILS